MPNSAPMMEDLLILCPLDPAGEAFWGRSAELFADDREARVKARLLLHLSSSQIFASTSLGVSALDSAHLVRFLQEQMPGRNISSLQVGVACSIEEPEVGARLDALLGAFEGISQVPAQLHLMVLAPDIDVKFPERAAALDTLLGAIQRQRLHCRDICWVRTETGADETPDRRVPDSRICAATHGLWSSQTEARRPFALLQGLQEPQRDSSRCRLVFDRSQWYSYAAADIVVRLTAFLEAPLQPKNHAAAAQWVRQNLLPLVRRLTQTEPGQQPSFERPASILDPLPVHALQDALTALRNQIHNQSAARTDELRAFIGTSVPPILDDIAGQAANELEGLIRAVQWATAAQDEIRPNRDEPNSVSKAALLPWIEASNHLLRMTSGLDPLPGFDLSKPDSWQGHLTVLRQQLSPRLVATGDKPISLAYCATAWICALLPSLFRGEEISQSIEDAVLAPISKALASQEERLLKVQKAHQAERQKVEGQYPSPTGVLSRFTFRLFREPQLRRVLKACDHTFEEQAAEVYNEVDRILQTGWQWLALAARNDDHRRLREEAARALRATVTASELVVQFLAERKRAEADLAQMPEVPPEGWDTLGLLSRAEMAALATTISPDASGWLEAARNGLQPHEATRQAVARECLRTIESWSAERARSLSVDLPELLDVHFPHLTSLRLQGLCQMARRSLLPVRNQNAARRRLHQEWHVPVHRRLGSHPAFEENRVTDDVVSTTPTTIARFELADRDCLELHVHVLGFKPQDYKYWKLFHVQQAPSPLEEPKLGQNPK